jgi:ComF family protein
VAAPLTALLDLLYPRACCCCGGRTAASVCEPCFTQLRFLRPPWCIRCGVPLQTPGDAPRYCGRCILQPPHFVRARAALIYEAQHDNPLARAIRRYKYDRDASLAPALARLLIDNLQQIPAPDLIVAVPLHRQRLQWRGFNQALLLAKRLGKHLRARVDLSLLQRTRATQPQVELGDDQRRANVRGAFRLSDPAAVRDRSILLMDDVMTTGATVDECSRVLLRAGAASVEVLTLARAVLY